MEAKISIIIPAYNVAGYLEKCLDSIIAQSFTEFEVILVDDGSTDNTYEICDDYAKNDCRIKVIHKKNEGVSIARNIGIEHAKGEYFLFFDGDDFVEPYTCEELYKLIREKQADTILYGYYRFENGKINEISYPIFKEGMYEKNSILKELVPRFIGIDEGGINRWLRHEEKALYVENPALWRAMVSCKLIKENQLQFDKSLKVGEDTIFISEYLSYSHRCYVHHRCYYNLVTRKTSTIYIYEKNPLEKLKNKLKLIDARLVLTQKIKEKNRQDISKTWHGTVIMSQVELAFLLSKKHPKYKFLKRYQLFLEYAKNPEVKRIVGEFKLKFVPSVMVIPFLLMKMKMYFLLFLCTTCLQLVNFKFQRN